MLGGNLFNIMTSGSAASTGNVLVGGSGFNIEQAGAGSDSLYDYSVPSYWTQAQVSALSKFKLVLPVTAPVAPLDATLGYQQLLAQEVAIFPQEAVLQTVVDHPTEAATVAAGSNVVSNLPAAHITGTTFVGSNTVQNVSSTAGLTVGQTVTGAGIPVGTIITLVDVARNTLTLSNYANTSGTLVPLSVSTTLLAGELVSGPGIPANTTIASVLSLTSIALSNNATANGASITVSLTPEQQARLKVLSNELANINFGELRDLPNQTVLVDYLKGGSGDSRLYGSSRPTWMVGGTGNDTFYNYNAADTLDGGGGNANAVTFQSDGNITVGQTPTNTGTVDLTIPTVNNGQKLTINPGSLKNVQILGIQLGDANDGVTVTTPSLGNFQGFKVKAGAGFDTIDATALTLPATLLGGSGNDTIKVGAGMSSGSVYDGGTGASELDVTGFSTNNQISVAGGVLNAGVNVPTTHFQKVVVTGGSGNNTFSTDGSLPFVSFAGGSGTNTLTIQCDNKGDSVTLKQKGSVVTIGGSVVGAATGMNSILVNGGAGNDLLDASGVSVPVTLDGGAGANTLKGGSGNDTLYYNNPSETYDGGGGVNNTLAYRANGDVISEFPDSFYDQTTNTYHDVGAKSNVDRYQVIGSNGSVAFGDDTFLTSNWTNTASNTNPPYTPPGTFSVTRSPNADNQHGAALTGTDTPPSVAGDVYEVYHLSKTLIYNPASQGAITSISASGDFYRTDTFAKFELILYQGGKYFAVSPDGVLPNTVAPGVGDWHHLTNFGASSPLNALTSSMFWELIPYGDPRNLIGGISSSTSSHPDFSTSGGAIQFGFATDATYFPTDLDIYNGRNNWKVANFAVQVNGASPISAFPVAQPISVSWNAGGGPLATSLTGSISDPNPTASTDLATINWGDGTSSPAPVANGSFSGAHIYASPAAYQITTTVTDSGGAAYSISGSVFIGLVYQQNGLFRETLVYNGYGYTPVYSQLDGNVAPAGFLVRNSDSTVFDTHYDYTLNMVSASGSVKQIEPAYPTGGTIYQSLAIGPDNTLYVFRRDGNLDTCPSGSTTCSTVETGVRSFIKASDGTLYKLSSNGSLYDLQSGAGWVLARQNVKSISQNGSAINVMETNGNYSRFDGSTWSLIARPHLSLSAPATAAVGQPATLTVQALDYFNSVVTAYSGTVHFTGGDAAGLPADYTFTVADAGSHTFNVTFATAGTQTLSVGDGAATASPVNVTVSAAPGARFGVTPAAATATSGVATAFTVLALDANGNVATGYTGTVHFTSTDPAATLPPDYTFTAADAGSHAFSATFQTPMGITLTATELPASVSAVSPAGIAGAVLNAASGPLTGSASLVNRAAAANLSQSTFAVTPSIPLGGTGAITFTARDASGNRLTAGGSLVTFRLGGGAGGGSLATADAAGTHPLTANPDGSFIATDNGDGTYTAILTGTAQGNNTITATIDGQAIPTPVTFTITRATVQAALTTPPGPNAFGQQVTFTITVSPSAGGGGTPSGPVTFLDNGTPLVGGTIALVNGTATFSTSALGVGGHTISVSYGGDGSFSTGASAPSVVTVTQATPTASVSVSGGVPQAGRPVTFTATVTPPGGGTPTGTVQFQIDGQNVGSPVALNGNTATLTTTLTSVGSHAVVAVYGGDANFAAASSATTTATVIDPAPALVATRVGDGSAQRSSVSSFTLTFSSPAALAAASFTLEQSQDGVNWIDVSSGVSVSNPSGDGVTWVFSCVAGGGLDRTAAFAAPKGLLANGVYRVTLHGAAIAAPGGGAPFNGGADQVVAFASNNPNAVNGVAQAFHVLFGDVNGDGTVNLTDYRAFTRAYLSGSADPNWNGAFDFDGNGTINLSDYRAFTRNYLKSLLY